MTINEVIEHCKRTVEFESKYIMKGRRGGGKVEYSKRYLEHKLVAEWLEELKEYRNLEEQGLLLKLPCKVGDVIYEVDEAILLDDVIEPIKCKVTYILLKTEIYIDVEVIEGHGIGSTYTFEVEDFGKTVFLTKEEAEKVLERLECAE